MAVFAITPWGTAFVSAVIKGIFAATTISAAVIKPRAGCSILAKTTGNFHLCNFMIHFVTLFYVGKLFNRLETFNRLLSTTGFSAFFT